jgi:hypothetical protein
MSSEWASKRVEAAHAANPLVGKLTAEKLKQLMEGELSKKALTPTELAKIATSLLSDVSKSQPTKKAEG